VIITDDGIDTVEEETRASGTRPATPERVARWLKRRVTLVASILVLGGSGWADAGCASVSHYVRAAVEHRGLGGRTASTFFCLYHGQRVLVDLRTKHVFFAGLHAVAAWRACTAGDSNRR